MVAVEKAEKQRSYEDVVTGQSLGELLLRIA